MPRRFLALAVSVVAALPGVLRLAAQGDPPEDPQGGTLVDCGAEKVAVFAHTESKDGHYALGWTIRPNHGKPPFDWSSYNREDPFGWMDKYPIDDEHPEQGDYMLLDGVIDLQAKRFTVVSSTLPYFPHKNHGDLQVIWFTDTPGTEYAVINNDARWDTHDLWLVRIDSQNVRITDLKADADKAVKQVLRRRVGQRNDRYAITYQSDKITRVGHAIGKSFSIHALKVPFDAEIPKSDAGNVEGVVTITLPKAEVTGATDNPAGQ